MTPSTATGANSNHSIFRRMDDPPVSDSQAPITMEGSNLLPAATTCSDDYDEDETLLYHDGCTVIRQTSTWGDHTIATVSSPHFVPSMISPMRLKIESVWKFSSKRNSGHFRGDFKNHNL